MQTLANLQAQHAIWLEHNFPDQQAHDALLGLIEEVGELAHAHLKASQGIRGTLEELRAEARDAIGDIVIYLASYCNTNGYDLHDCVDTAWKEVRKRDWIKYPERGLPLRCATFSDLPGPYTRECQLDLNHEGDHEWGPTFQELIDKEFNRDGS